VQRHIALVVLSKAVRDTSGVVTVNRVRQTFEKRQHGPLRLLHPPMSAQDRPIGPDGCTSPLTPMTYAITYVCMERDFRTPVRRVSCESKPHNGSPAASSDCVVRLLRRHVVKDPKFLFQYSRVTIRLTAVSARDRGATLCQDWQIG
jgi:hypothetical protein